MHKHLWACLYVQYSSRVGRVGELERVGVAGPGLS